MATKESITRSFETATNYLVSDVPLSEEDFAYFKLAFTQDADPTAAAVVSAIVDAGDYGKGIRLLTEIGEAAWNGDQMVRGDMSTMPPATFALLSATVASLAGDLSTAYLIVAYIHAAFPDTPIDRGTQVAAVGFALAAANPQSLVDIMRANGTVAELDAIITEYAAA